MTKSRRMSKYDFTTIDFDNIDIHDVKYLPLFMMVMFCMCYPHYLWMLIVHMVVLWETWIRCVTATLGVQQNQQIFKMILDSLSSILLVLTICNLQTNIVNICIMIEVSLNCVKWIGSTFVPYFVRNVSL